MLELLEQGYQESPEQPVVKTMSSPDQQEWHEPAMIEECIHYLNPRSGGIVVDATVGTGGHSHAVLPRILPEGRLIAMDRDRFALRMARQRLNEFSPRVSWLHENFRYLSARLKELGVPRIDGLLLDLGMSSYQVNNPQRGFSFLKEGPLDMRMDDRQGLTAEMLVNELSDDELTGKLSRFGEERYSKRIARRIVQARKENRITTTAQLAQIVERAVPVHARFGRLHPATRTFQALRISVNDELGALQEVLSALNGILSPGARVVVLSFHSLEDRIVKHAFIEGARAGLWSILTKKPLTPSHAEVSRNPRARSVKLRSVEAN